MREEELDYCHTVAQLPGPRLWLPSVTVFDVEDRYLAMRKLGIECLCCKNDMFQLPYHGAFQREEDDVRCVRYM